MAAIKETADKTKERLVAGQAARVVAQSVLKQMSNNRDLAVVYLKRTQRQGWPGNFLPAVAVLVEQTLSSEGKEMQFDAIASRDISQAPTNHGYGNPAVPRWREDFLGLVFAPAKQEMAEVISLPQIKTAEPVRRVA